MRKHTGAHAHKRGTMNDNNNNTLNMALAHEYCRRFGLMAGGAWSLSFLLAMWGLSSPLMGNLGTIVGLLSVVLVGRLLQRFRLEVFPTTYRQTWWMAIVTYGCATLVTALVQYLYFRFLDHGQLYNFFVAMLENPEYKQLLLQASHGLTVKEIEKMMSETMLSPTAMTLTLLWYNIILGLILSIPSALIGMRKGNKIKNQ